MLFQQAIGRGSDNSDLVTQLREFPLEVQHMLGYSTWIGKVIGRHKRDLQRRLQWANRLGRANRDRPPAPLATADRIGYRKCGESFYFAKALVIQ